MTAVTDLPKGRTLTSALVAHLRATIMRGEMAPGAKLNVYTLSKQFGVSLSPLREALSRLAAEGLLVANDQRGYRISELSRADLEEIILLRQTLEGLALRCAIDRNDPAWRADAAAWHVDLLAQERSRNFLVEQWEASHRRYHAALIAGAALPLLLETCEKLHDRSDRYRRMFLRHRAKDRTVIDEHHAILVTALSGDADRAVTLLQDHIARTGCNILRLLDEQAKAP